MKKCFAIIMNGEATDIEISAFLSLMAGRTPTAEELTGAASILRQKAAHIAAPDGSIDCCGTGGDTASTYNISTAVALVSAACGVPVAKHGNRAASSKSGAADVLEALGVHLDMDQTRLEQALRDIGFCFLMAPNHHKSMGYVVPVRKALGFRTIFNALGPLANPAGTQYQLIGVYDPALLLPMAETLKNLGTKSAWVVHGNDGMDEITTTSTTQIAILKDGQITQQTLNPEDFDVPYAKPEDLAGGSAEDNAKALQELLDGEKNAYRDIVCVNTAAVLMIASKCASLKQGVVIAAQAIDDGSARSILETYRTFSKKS